MEQQALNALSEQQTLLAKTRAAEAQARMAVLYYDYRTIDDRTAVEALNTLKTAIDLLAEAVSRRPANYAMVRRHLGPMLDQAEKDTRRFIGLWQSTMDVLVLLEFLDLADTLTAEYIRAARAYIRISGGDDPYFGPGSLRRTSKRVAA